MIVVTTSTYANSNVQIQLEEVKKKVNYHLFIPSSISTEWKLEIKVAHQGFLIGKKVMEWKDILELGSPPWKERDHRTVDLIWISNGTYIEMESQELDAGQMITMAKSMK